MRVPEHRREGTSRDRRTGSVRRPLLRARPPLVRLAGLLGDDDPEDVVQDSFCKLYAARGRYRPKTQKVSYPT